MKHDPHAEDEFDDFVPSDKSIPFALLAIVGGVFMVTYCLYKLLEMI